MHISFSEILLILIVALLVIKPAHLPDAARTLGRWFRWLRQTNEKIKTEMQKPLDLFSYQNAQIKTQSAKKEIDEIHL